MTRSEPGTALLAAIRAAPDDDAPRLVYADWLDEHGDPVHAEFIRVQIARGRNDSKALAKREAALLAEHHDALAGPLARPGFRFHFHRGFIVAFGHTGCFHRPFGVASQFYLNGTWLYGPPFDLRPGQPELEVRPLRRQGPAVESGTYVLNGLEHPATLRLYCSEYERIGIDAHAVMEDGSIRLILFQHGKARRVDEPYHHLSLGDFATYSEI